MRSSSGCWRSESDFVLVSEELGERTFGAGGARRVVVDPIDGSVNAKRGIPFFSFSLAVAEGPTMGDVFFGYVYDFGTGEEWTAERGKGAFLGGVPLGAVRPKDPIEILSFEGTTTPSVAERAERMVGLAERMRVMGSLALSLCHLADGRVDAACCLKDIRSVDIAAAQLLARRARHRSRALRRPASCIGAARSRHALAACCGRDARARGGARRRTALGTLDGMKPDRDAILKALEQVIDPEIRKPVTELDMVRDVLVEDDGAVSVTIALTVAGCPLRHSFEEQVGKAVGAVEGVTSVRLGFDVMSPQEKAALVSRLQGGRTERGRSRCRRRHASSLSRRARAESGSRRSRPTSPTRSPRSARRSESSTATCTGTRSRTCSASTRSRSRWTT